MLKLTHVKNQEAPILLCFPRKYLFLPAFLPSFSIPLERFCWWLLGLLRMPVWPVRVGGRQRRDAVAQKLLEKEKGGMWKTVLYCFFPCMENKCSGDNADSNNMTSSTPVAGNESGCCSEQAFPCRTAITMYTINTITAAWTRITDVM